MPNEFEYGNNGTDGRRIFCRARARAIECVRHTARHVDYEIQIGAILLGWQNFVAAQARVGNWWPTIAAAGRHIETASSGTCVVRCRHVRWRIAAPAAPKQPEQEISNKRPRHPARIARRVAGGNQRAVGFERSHKKGAVRGIRDMKGRPGAPMSVMVESCGKP